MAEAPTEASTTGAERPRSIKDLCRVLGTVFPNISVPCHYCQRPLSVLDIFGFEQSHLSLIWRDGYPKGICSVCCRLLARLEFTHRHLRSCKASQASLYIGTDLSQVDIRCINCLCKLTSIERGWYISDDRTVHVLINKQVRAPCVRCTMGFY